MGFTWQNLKEVYKDINGTRVYYRTVGEGQPVILIHGLGADWEMWGKAIPYLASGYKVFALDLPGHGKSDKPDVPYDINYFTDFLADFICTLELGKVVVVGVSMGGQTALKLAIRRPELVEKLVLVDSSGLSPLYHGAFKIPGAAWIFTYIASRWTTINLWCYRCFFVDKHYVTAQVVQEYLERLKRPGARQTYYRNILAVSWPDKDLPREIKKVTMPTLIVWGRDDKIMPLKDAHRFKAGIINSKLVVINNCGHVPPVEKYREFNGALLDFLR